jgi:serine/threonine protein phosphatase PrpC
MTTKMDLLRLLRQHNIIVKNASRLSKIDLVNTIIKIFKLKKEDLIYYYSVDDLKILLRKHKIPNNKIKQMKRKSQLFNTYMIIKGRIKQYKTYSTYFYLAQGKRDYMEDFIFYFQNNFTQFSAVFDGHGGKECSSFLKRNFFSYFQRGIAKSHKIKHALIDAYMNAQKNFLNKNLPSGSTCNTLVINKKTNNFFIANVGDSRAIICYKNNKVKQISKDHKPSNKLEKKRIEQKGGFVQENRVDGILAMSRSIGDKRIHHHLSSTPDIFEGSLKNVKYIVQASDGLYDVLSNSKVCDYINTHIKNGTQKKDIPYYLVNHAIKNKGSMDNVSVIISFIQ